MSTQQKSQSAKQIQGKSKVQNKQSMNSKKLKQQKIQNQKEESLREILGFFTNQVDAKKFLKKKTAKDLLDKDINDKEYKEEKIQDEFLNPNEFAEVKGTYDDYNIGDLAIIFQNPDSDNCENKPISFKDAVKIYDEMLTVMTDEVSKSQMKKERCSFLLAFLTLDDYEDKKDEGNQKKKKKKNLKKEDKQKTVKTLQTGTQFGEEKEQLQKKQEKTSYDRYLDFLRMYKKQEQDQKLQEDEQKKGGEVIQQKKQAYLDEIGIEPDKMEVNPNMVLDPIKELQKVDISDTSQFKKVKKKWCQGQYLKKTKIDEFQEKYEWTCQNTPPKDFLTLIRFTIMAKLCRNGFLHCRQFINGTGELIFLILKSSKEVVKRSAQNMKVTKQIELGFADLFSLEPVDESFRPLRLKNYIRQYTNNEEIKKKLQEILDSRKEAQNKEEEYRKKQDMQDKKDNKDSNTDPNQALVDQLQHFKKMQEFKEKKYIDQEEIKIEENIQQQNNQTIGNYCDSLYPIICQWDDILLQVYTILKQQDVDKIMKIIAKELNIDQSHEKVELINDKDITRKEWEIYYIYMEILQHFGQKIQNLKKKGNTQIQENQAFLYKLIFRKALGDANELWYKNHPSVMREITQNKSILLNLWGRLNVDPVAPYTEFFQPNNEVGNSMWRKYEVNEKGLRSEFINMEKIKITHAIVLKNINILKMIKELIVTAYFPIHDHYQLQAIPKSPFFEKLIEGEFMQPKEDTEHEYELKNLFNELKDEAEPTDFDSDSLEKSSAFNFRIPWHVSINSMRDYFGEKIALYFSFLSYFTKQLWYMAIIGIIAQGLISASTEQAKSTMIILFSLAIIIWSTFFIEFWKREQILFSVQFGQQNFEEDEAERPAFQGKYIRSITNDDLNEEFYSPFLRKMKQLFSLAVSFLIIGCVIGSVLGIFFFKNLMLQQKADPFYAQNVPALLNFIQINFFNFVYQKLSDIFNMYENHKILSSYENSLIAKIFIFMFVNNFNSFFIISFLSGYFSQLQLCKVSEDIQNDCFQVLSNQMTVIFLSNIGKNIPELATPYIKAFITKQMKSKTAKEVEHAFKLIDSAIDDQMELEPYQTNEEVDGTVNDYMELVIQFSYLALFGLAFPSCYILAFVSNIIEIQVDKFKLIRVSRRPFPQGAATIGNWLIILEVITFFGIFSNSGLIVYTSQTIQTNQIVIFSVLLVVFLALKYFIRFLVPDEPESATILNKRHQYVVDKVVKGFAQTGQKSYTPAKINLKIGGVIYSQQVSQIFNQDESSNRNEEIAE
ncbi:unnamed protein product [Paramecium primaurelia]|uniref:Anoctamin transmembrane domain-containing protein n=1 Tax=Paramecium primaurelia TaxID=5886 RepID=A0A8S1PRJ6_PARPR|nr:unnamed protein product [Paramecium primaurelia]